MKISRIAVLAFALLPSLCLGQWNLPYPRPAVYDYSNYYDTRIAGLLNSNKNRFAEELAKGWSFFKGRYILANGLVNHERGAGGIGQNEAVSEGQGYGMILALLNNDQATFNRIFKAANQYMWDNRSQSYFVWNWPSGANPGAATDADLDIGLALVFADGLVEKGIWQAFSSPSYKSRAMEVIKSIGQNMTQDNYLLPGDNWGGSAINNLNPSYFATAWLKVFNEYQDEIDFAPVIDKCYQVIAKMPRYSHGQAADWITPNGGTASKGSRDMGNDAIRVPWRLAMDALWYNDARAIAYCRNTKKTLNNYNVSDLAVLGQMRLYKENGQPFGEESVLIHHAAMWASGALGSKDIEYAKGVLNEKVFPWILGDSGDHFGSKSQGDHYYYYNQAVAMLGFATISGQFPNVWADMQGPLEPPEPVRLQTALSANKDQVELPGSVVFTATIDKSASWTLIIQGKTSGKSTSFEGTESKVSATWTGVGHYEKELVEATLSVIGLDESTAGSKLKTTVEIVKAPEKPSIEPGAELLVHDMGNNSTVTDWGGAWYLYTDADEGGSSKTTPDKATGLVDRIAGNPSAGIKIQMQVQQYAGVGFTLKKTGTLDLSNIESVVFDYKIEGLSKVYFQLPTTNITNYAWNRKELSPSTSWKTVAIRISELEPPEWSPSTRLDASKAEKMQWQAEGAQSGALYIDNVKLKLKSGMLPGPDIMALMESSAPIAIGYSAAHHTWKALNHVGHVRIAASAIARPIQATLWDLSGRQLWSENLISAHGSATSRNAVVEAGLYILRLDGFGPSGAPIRETCRIWLSR